MLTPPPLQKNKQTPDSQLTQIRVQPNYKRSNQIETQTEKYRYLQVHDMNSLSQLVQTNESGQQATTTKNAPSYRPVTQLCFQTHTAHKILIIIYTEHAVKCLLGADALNYCSNQLLFLMRSCCVVLCQPLFHPP